ncbi:MAG TPA: AMP-binding protein [Gemmatimonadaceae bacterium]|nr:AMP-binding protein [Gemmatimonadaceae bacterium]
MPAGTSLHDLFAASLKGRASAPGLDVEVDGELRSLTFGEIDARSHQLAAEFAARGVQAGDRLALFLPNGIDFIDAFLAAVKLGAIVVPVNVLYRERELTHILADASPRALITTKELLDHVPQGTEKWLSADLQTAARRHPAHDSVVRQAPDAPAAIVYTSGTTGRAKGAVLSHRNFAFNATSLLSCWRITSDDRYLAVLPLFHVHGLGNGVCSWLASGCHMRLVERFDANRALEWFTGWRPTLFFGVPTMYFRMLEWPPDECARIGRQMRLFVSGSAPLPARVLEDFRQRFGHTILERYGMSETLMNLGNPYDGERRPGSVGVPFPGVEARVVDAQGAVVRDGEVGGLQVRGPNVFSGYWRNPAATAAAFVDGWFRTGDLAERSADGYYTLRGRSGDLIISGGFNIYPREIEEVLLECPGVREAAVVGVSDVARGEIPIAYVVAEDPFDETVLVRTCERQLASFKRPRSFVRVEALPRNALGKVQRHLLPTPHA